MVTVSVNERWRLMKRSGDRFAAALALSVMERNWSDFLVRKTGMFFFTKAVSISLAIESARSFSLSSPERIPNSYPPCPGSMTRRYFLPDSAGGPSTADGGPPPLSLGGGYVEKP